MSLHGALTQPRSPRFQFATDRGTDFIQTAMLTVRLARITDLPAVSDHAVIEHHPVLGRQESHDILLDLCRVGVRCETEPSAESVDVRVHSDAGHAEAIA